MIAWTTELAVFCMILVGVACLIIGFVLGHMDSKSKKLKDREWH